MAYVAEDSTPIPLSAATSKLSESDAYRQGRVELDELGKLIAAACYQVDRIKIDPSVAIGGSNDIQIHRVHDPIAISIAKQRILQRSIFIALLQATVIQGAESAV